MIPARNRWYRDALGRPHSAYSRVEVWRSGVLVDELVWRERGSMVYSLDMPVFFGGTVRATLGSKVTRTLTLSVPDSLYPWKSSDLLNPYGQELRAFRGIRYGNNSPDEFPIFVGPIYDAKPTRNGEVTIGASDNSIRVSAAGFPSPLPAQTGALVVDEYERLVLDAYPAATFGRHDVFTDRVPPGLTYDSDRGAALDALAKIANAFWYTLADGAFVLRRVPWATVVTSAPVALRDGQGGTLISAFPTRSAQGLANSITVICDRPDGGVPFYATVEDTDPASPTYVGGPFGIRSIQVKLTSAANQGQVVRLAQQLLVRAKSLTESWDITCQPDASLELGDALDVSYRGHEALQVAAGFTMPLDVNASMSIDGRAYFDPTAGDLT